MLVERTTAGCVPIPGIVETLRACSPTISIFRMMPLGVESNAARVGKEIPVVVPP
jgi:hypothetical protein